MDREIFNLISRVHVIFRYQEKRDLDVARMQTEPEYAKEILNYCTQSTYAELVHLGNKLNTALFGENGAFSNASDVAATTSTSPDTKKYIRSLR